MRTRPFRTLGMIAATSAAMVALAAPTLAGAAAAARQGETPTRLYAVTNVSLASAERLATSFCMEFTFRQRADEQRPTCHVVPLEEERTLAVTAGAEPQQRIAALLAELDRVPVTRSFHIVVLAASRIGNATAELPIGVSAALDDIREFLPYTSYRELAAGWIRTSRFAQTTLPGEMEFTARIEFRSSPDASEPILVDGFHLGRPGGQVLQTTFSIEPGETYVVGTSKLDGGDDALVVLLTAVRN
ncbi:MAG TPA: hypothetical protein VGD06_07635 [Acidobacteriota bacterium]